MQHSALQLHVHPSQGEECMSVFGCFKDPYKGRPSSHDPSHGVPATRLNKIQERSVSRGAVCINIMACIKPPPLESLCCWTPF